MGLPIRLHLGGQGRAGGRRAGPCLGIKAGAPGYSQLNNRLQEAGGLNPGGEVQTLPTFLSAALEEAGSHTRRAWCPLSKPTDRQGAQLGGPLCSRPARSPQAAHPGPAPAHSTTHHYLTQRVLVWQNGQDGEPQALFTCYCTAHSLLCCSRTSHGGPFFTPPPLRGPQWCPTPAS